MPELNELTGKQDEGNEELGEGVGYTIEELLADNAEQLTTIFKVALREVFQEFLGEGIENFGQAVKAGLMGASDDLTTKLLTLAAEAREIEAVKQVAGTLEEREAAVAKGEARNAKVKALFDEWFEYIQTKLAAKINRIEDTEKRQQFIRENEASIAHFRQVMEKYEGIQREYDEDDYGEDR